MKKSAKSMSLFVVVSFVLGVCFVLETKARHTGGSDRGSPGSSSNFEEFKLPFLRCSETTMLCGINDPESPQLGADPLLTTQGSRARIKKFGRLEVRLEGAVPNKAYDVLLVYTPGGSVDCSSFDPSTCTADCTDSSNPLVTCDFEPANCTADCTDPNNPVISCSLDPANCNAALTLVLVGSFTTDNRGKGSFEANVSGVFANRVDSVHVMITDHDEDTTQVGDVPRQFITGVKIR
jgi:hypothetical protein